MGITITNLEKTGVLSSNARKRILSDPLFQEDLKALLGPRGMPLEEGMRLSDAYLKEIATSYSRNIMVWRVMEFLVRKLILGRFEHVHVEPSGLHRIKELSKTHIVQIVPSHKSVFDFFLLPYYLAKESSLMTLILAGEVFSKFPLGVFLRRMAAYFVRRNSADKIYALVFRHYVMLIVSERMLQMFFVEGGRNKKGTFSEPKSGMLKYILEGRRRHIPGIPIAFMPACISYDIVPESDILVKEQASGKRANIMTSMSRYFSKKKYGNCYIKFSDPIIIPPNEPQTREFISSLGERILEGIKGALIISPNTILCHALMRMHAKGTTSIQKAQLKNAFLEIRQKLKDKKGDVSYVSGQKFDECLESAREKLLIALEHQHQETVVRIIPSSIPIIEYCSNNIAHLVDHHETR